MKTDVISRIISATLLGTLVGWGIHHNIATWNVRGREAFIAYQTRRFETNLAYPSALSSNIVAAVLFILGTCVVYELIAYYLSSALNGFASGKKVG